MASELQVPTFHTRASRWSHAVFMPVAARPVSRHPPSFLPDQQLEPGFGDVPTLSTLHQRFTCVRLTGAHLTGDSRLFRNAHHPGRGAAAACGGLDPGPATRVRGAFPHLLCSKVLRVDTATSSEPPLRTVVAHSCRHSSARYGGWRCGRGAGAHAGTLRGGRRVQSWCCSAWNIDPGVTFARRLTRASRTSKTASRRTSRDHGLAIGCVPDRGKSASFTIA